MKLIDADALGIGRCNPDVFQNAAYAAGWNGVINIIRSSPAIDAVPVVHGQWERIPLNAPDDRYGMNKYNMRIKCTACGFVAPSDFIGFRYCYSCGAKMDGAGR